MLVMIKKFIQATMLVMTLFPVIVAKGSNLYSREAIEGVQISLEKVLSGCKVGGRIQCLHRCKRDPKCMDVAITDANVCLLLGDNTQVTAKDAQVTVNVNNSRGGNSTVEGSIIEWITRIKFDSGKTCLLY